MPPCWRDGSEPPNPNGWPRDDLQALEAFYGPPGAERLVRIEPPYPHRLAWDPRKTVRHFLCHRKVKDSLERVLERVLNHYGREGIRELRLDLWGGCFNERKIRGGTRWSTHAWGIALDYDPARNRFKWGWDRAAFARPEYDAWWQCWEAEGWISMGRQRNFDWMHVQAARL